MHTDGFMSPEGKLLLNVGLPPPLTAFSASRKAISKKSRPATSNTVKFAAARKSSVVTPQRAPDDYIRRLNIGLSFSRDFVRESVPTALKFEEIRPHEIYSAPKRLLTQKKRSQYSHGIQGRHNAIGDPITHLPCALTVPAHSASLRQVKSYPVKPYLKKTVQEEESVAAQTSVAASTIQWDEYVLNKLTFDTADIIVNRYSHGQQRDRLQQKVLSDAKDTVESEIFQETQFMEVEPIIVDRKHGIEQDSSKASVWSCSFSESDDKESNVTKPSKPTKEDKALSLEEEYIPKYLGKPLQRNYMEKFMTKAQRKRETQGEEDKYVTSLYNRHKLQNDIEPFTEDVLQGKFSIHHPGNRSRIIFDSQTQYKRDLIPCYPQQPATWGPRQLSKRNVPIRGHRPWKQYPQLIITSYQRQVLNDLTSETESRATPGLGESIYDSDELSHDLLIDALSTWRTTWYLDNKWRDCTLDNLITDMKDICEHVRITAAIGCGAALGFRADWDLDDSPDLQSTVEGDDIPISGYRTYSPSEPASSTEKSVGHVVVENLQKLLYDKSDRVQVSAAVTCLAIGACNERAKQVLLRALNNPTAMKADTWAAVQCLAMENVTERIVVNKLIGMSQSLDSLIRVTATKLLVRLSYHSDVILFMVADKLNNRLWTNRYMACKVIQKIATPLNKDILHKLLTLMWSDYSENIRSVAGETIGVKGYGHVLHDELCCRLRKGNESEKVDALNRIIHLTMMTGRMKSVFLKCFTDDHVSVRLTAAKGAGKLRFSDNDAIEGLLSLITDDHSHKVKAAAIEALADIRVVNDRIISQLVWSAQYQQEGPVRAAACVVLAMLKVDRDDVVNVLRDRLTADADPDVKRASTTALLMLGLKPEKDASLILAIKEAVKKLGSKEAILSSIINADAVTSAVFDSLDGMESDNKLLRSRGSKTSLTRQSSRGVDKRGSRDKASGSSASLQSKWPEPAKVIERDREIRTKKDKIQAILNAHENETPVVKFLWKKDSPKAQTTNA